MTSSEFEALHFVDDAEWGVPVFYQGGQTDLYADEEQAGRTENPWSTPTYGGPRRHRPRATDLDPGLDPGLDPALDPGRDPGRDRDGVPGVAGVAGVAPDPSAQAAGRVVDAALIAAYAQPDTTGAAGDSSERSLLSNSRTMAIASLVSRVTGFLRSAAIAAALGVVGSGVADAYNLANMLPNMVYELLIGGVLSSVIVPLLVHAQVHHRDHGVAYTQRLLSVSTAALGVATLFAVAAAPVLAWALVNSGDQRALASMWATLLLPEIFFYGLGAVIAAVLNSRHEYAAPAWAPVLNNVVVLGTVGVYLLLPGPKVLTPSSITTTQILVLGIGTTLGIVVQSLVLLPALRKVGFHWKWRFRGDAVATVTPTDVPGPAVGRGKRGGAGLGEERKLIGWVLGYVVISQIGLLVISRVAVSNTGLTTFVSADLLFQVPYGILGVSLLTALMPRMSRAAAHDDVDAVVGDLTLGIRLSAVALVPISLGLMVLGPALGTVIFAHGATSVNDARHVGIVLAMASFGLLPFAVVMLQLRVFYAMKDARVPTLVNVGMVGVKVILVLIAAASFPSRHVVEALSVATSVSYVVGAIIGHRLLVRRLGQVPMRAVGVTVGKVVAASAVAAGVALVVLLVVSQVFGTGLSGSLFTLFLGTAFGVLALWFTLTKLKVPELREIAAGVRR